MSDVTSYQVTGDWRHIVEDGIVDDDPLPDEVMPTGHVTFTPLSPRVAVAGVPATAYTLGADKALIAGGVLTDMQGRPGMSLAGKIGDTPVRWRAVIHLEYRGQKIDYPPVEFDLTEDMRLSGIIQQAGRLTPIVIDPRIEALAARLSDVDHVVADAEQIVADAGQSVVDAGLQADRARDEADRAIGLATAQDEAVAEHVVTDGRQTRTAVDERILAVGNATYDRIGRPERANMQVYEHATARGIKVLWQDGALLYGAWSNGAITRSVDRGASWSNTGGTVSLCDAILRLSSGTLLATSNSTNRMHRSTDDGATWSQVKVLTDKVLGHQGLLECPDGSVLQADYGTSSTTVYELWRSTDEGQTWVKVFTPTWGPSATQIHCVVWDHIEQCVILMTDDMVPEHWRSDDYGQTWTLIGRSTEQIHPNWVAPMFFDNYIAWGYDSELGGRIARISRSDFYAGNWNAATIEQIAHVNGKAWYWTFPVRPDMWIVALAHEVITPGWGGGEGNTREYGSWSEEVYIVWGDGGKVNGGMAWANPFMHPGSLSGGGKIGFPGYPREFGDQMGITWPSFQVRDGVSVSSVPVSAGWGDPLAKVNSNAESVTVPILRNGEELMFRSADGGMKAGASMHSSNRLVLFNRESAALPEVRIQGGSLGQVQITHSGATSFEVIGEGVRMPTGKAIRLGGNTGPQVLHSAADPEGVVSARAGSICLASNGGVYMKLSGTSVTGWRRLATVDDLPPSP